MNQELPGYRGLRGQVLLEIKKSQPVTAKELSSRFLVSANAVRRHLKELEHGGLIRYVRQQRGVGAPAFAYRLSDQGEALFPKRYEETLTELLEHVEERVGRAAAVEVFEEHYAVLTRKLRAQLEGAPAGERVKAVTRAMSEAGYMAECEGEEANGTFRLAEHNCAIRAVAEHFPEVCAAEAKFLREVLSAAVERRAHIVAGCNACEYAITFGRGAPAAAERLPERQQERG